MGFTDLLSSSKGPGVIGTGLALVVLGGFATLYLFVFDADLQGGQKKIEAVVRDQANEIVSLKNLSAERRKRLEDGRVLAKQADEIEQLQKRLEASARQIAEDQDAKAAAEQAVLAAAEKFEQYKQAYRDSEWAAAKGESLGELKTLDGKVYKKAILRYVDVKGISIIHESGQGRVDSAVLPLALQDRLQFDAEQKKKGEEVEKSQTDDHVEDVAYAQKNAQFGKNQRQIDELTAGVAKARLLIQQDTQSLPVQEMQINSYRNQITVERTKKLSDAPQMEVRLGKMKQTLEDTKRRIPATEKKISEDQTKIASLTAENAKLKIEITKIAADYKARNAAAAKGDKP